MLYGNNHGAFVMNKALIYTDSSYFMHKTPLDMFQLLNIPQLCRTP